MNYQSYVEDLFKHACLASCYSYLARGKFDWVQITQDILDGVKNKYLESDCWVEYPVKYLGMMGLKIRDIEKVFITSLEQLPDNGIYVVEYKKDPKDKASHFVIVKDKKVVFDPSEPSQTVKVGAPYSFRKLIY